MSCCGKKRAQLQQASPAQATTGQIPAAETLTPNPVVPTWPASRDSKWFEYTGPFELNVSGAVTQRLYRFSRPGAQVEVALEDIPALMAVKDLRLRKR